MQSHPGHTFKNDGVVSILSARWSADDGLDDLNNEYFDDVDEDGGYNHFELRNYERAYDLKAENGSYLFRKGDRAPQYDKIYVWLDNLFKNSN